jgi:hypothetical protein
LVGHREVESRPSGRKTRVPAPRSYNSLLAATNREWDPERRKEGNLTLVLP